MVTQPPIGGPIPGPNPGPNRGPGPNLSPNLSPTSVPRPHRRATAPQVVDPMPDARALRNRFVDAPGSLGERLRVARWERLRGLFPAIEDMAVVDLGGTDAVS